jgi:elongation factor G
MAKYKTEQIRNVALLGHSGAGKTTLSEALLYKTGVVSRMGRVEDGTTVSDWDPEEQRRGISVNLSIVPVEFNNTKLNLIDTPGYQDFVGEVISGMFVAEAGLVVVDAVAGCQVGTELAYDRLRELAKPRLIFLNRMDRENANFADALQSLRRTLGDEKIVPFQIPLGVAETFKGVIGLIEMKAYLGPEGKEVPIPPEFLAEAEAARFALVEAAAEADDELILKYLDGETLSVDEVRHGLHVGVRNCAITPVYCGTATGGIGMVDAGVAPLRAGSPRAHASWNAGHRTCRAQLRCQRVSGWRCFQDDHRPLCWPHQLCPNIFRQTEQGDADRQRPHWQKQPRRQSLQRARQGAAKSG